MNYNKNVVEEALFQIRNLEETLQENAKGILQSTMSEEIKQLVKESLREQEEIEDPVDDEEMDPEMEMDDEDMEMDDEDMEMDPEMGMEMDPEMGMEMDPEMGMDDETIDMTDASDNEVLRVFKAMGDDDGIIVKKEGSNLHFTDGDSEYLIQLSEQSNRRKYLYEEQAMKFEEDDMFNMDDDDMDDMDDMDNEEMEFEPRGRNRFSDMDDMDDEEETSYEIDMDDEEMGFEPRGRNRFSDMDDMDDEEMEFEPRGRNRFSDMDDMDDEEETSYEIEMDEQEISSAPIQPQLNQAFNVLQKTPSLEEEQAMKFEQEDEYSEYSEQEDEYYEQEDYQEDPIMEAIKKMIKQKGTENRRGPKFSYDKKPNMGGGFNEKRKEAFGKGIKATGTGKPKFEYKKGENMEKGSMRKVETKEAARTYGNGSKDGSRGLRKAKTNNRNYEYSPFKISENYSNNEVYLLKEKNEEYKAALDVFRTKLNEVAVFNSNLAYATRLFTEHSTTKQEKINILRRFDNLESLKESKNLYRTIKGELSSNGSTGEQKINESIQRTVNKTADTGSSVNLIESKTYENPQFLRMKDLMTKIK